MDKQSAASRTPFRQGSLDGLCGLYSIINAIKLMHGGQRIPSKSIFKDSLRQLAEAHVLADIVVNGMQRITLSGVLKVAAQRVTLSRSWPFHGKKRPTLAEVWSALEAHVCEEEGRVAIIVFGGERWGHWTVVRAVTPRKLVLFDSRGRSHLNRAICTTGEPTKTRPVTIEAVSTCLLKRE